MYTFHCNVQFFNFGKQKENPKKNRWGSKFQVPFFPLRVRENSHGFKRNKSDEMWGGWFWDLGWETSSDGSQPDEDKGQTLIFNSSFQSRIFKFSPCLTSRGEERKFSSWRGESRRKSLPRTHVTPNIWTYRCLIFSFPPHLIFNFRIEILVGAGAFSNWEKPNIRLGSNCQSKLY